MYDAGGEICYQVIYAEGKNCLNVICRLPNAKIGYIFYVLFQNVLNIIFA